MAFSQTDLDNIQAAIAIGELSVEVNGRKVVYRSMVDLMAAETRIRTALAEASTNTSSTTRRGSYRVNFETHRGF